MYKINNPHANLFEELARDAIRDGLVFFKFSARDLLAVRRGLYCGCSLNDKEQPFTRLLIEDKGADCDLVVLRVLREEFFAGDVV